MKRIVGFVLGSMVVCGIVWATVPNTFNTGDALSASKVNDNFSALDTRVSALEAPAKVVVTHSGKKWSLGAVYCAATANTTGLITNGYAGAKTQCETTCSSPSAHMCTSEEMVRTLQMAIPSVPTGWFSSGTFGEQVVSPGGYYINDCTAWTNNSGTNDGTAYQSSGSVGISLSSCSASQPILCCD
jgi:hypothetical protein